MKRRTTIEIDDDLLSRAKRVLGTITTRRTVEEALRRAADAADVVEADRAARQRQYLDALPIHADVTLLASDDMWR